VLNGWTVGRIDLLIELWSVKQWSANEIALELGGFEHCADGGRSAVIGKVHRLKLPARECDRSGLSKATNTGRRREARPKTRHIASHLIKVAREAAQRVVEEVAPEPDLDIPPHQRVPLLALTHETCRFPIGDPGDPDFGFCPNRARRRLVLLRAPPSPRLHAARAGQAAPERKETGWG
jgi:GcrA cell cycle regulator